MVIVVAEDIPKYTELTYDYGSDYVLGGEVSAAPTNIKQLLVYGWLVLHSGIAGIGPIWSHSALVSCASALNNLCEQQHSLSGQLQASVWRAHA
jgi:hypothetical protein